MKFNTSNLQLLHYFLHKSGITFGQGSTSFNRLVSHDYKYPTSLNGHDDIAINMWNLFLSDTSYKKVLCIETWIPYEGSHLVQNYGHQLLTQCNLALTQSQSAKDSRFVCLIFRTLLTKFGEERQPKQARCREGNAWEFRENSTACTRQKEISHQENSYWHGMKCCAKRQCRSEWWIWTVA